MAAQMFFQIFLFDQLVSEPGKLANKDRLAEVHRIVDAITPNSKATRISFRGKGFLVSFDKEDALNLFFHPISTETLKEHHLTAEIGINSQPQRVVFIPDVTIDTIQKDVSEIISHIQNDNNIKILSLQKIIQKKNNIKLTLDSSKSAMDIITAGKIKVFSEIIKAEAQHIRPRVPNSHHINPPNYSNSPSRWINSAQNIGNWLPPTSDWASSREPVINQQQPTASPSYHEDQLRNFCLISHSMCEFLSRGIENPELYVSMCNDIHREQNLPIIKVPKSITDSSKMMFTQKKAMAIISTPSPNTDSQTPASQPQSSHQLIPHNNSSSSTTNNTHSIPVNTSQTSSIPPPSPPSSSNTALQAPSSSTSLILTSSTQSTSSPHYSPFSCPQHQFVSPQCDKTLSQANNSNHSSTA